MIKRALAAGIWLVNVGSQKDTSLAAVELARKYPQGVYAAVGLHPIHTGKSFHDADELGAPPWHTKAGLSGRGEEFDYEYYKKLAGDDKVVAIGECGLDYAAFVREQSEWLKKRASAEAGGEGGSLLEDIETRKRKQKEIFLKHITLAKEVGKPLMIHCRDAYKDLIDILVSRRMSLVTSGVVHFFSGTVDQAKELLDLGFYFTFGGVITFTGTYDEVVRSIPLDRLMVETDAPYVAPAPYRGQRNEPVYVVEAAKKLAEIKNLEVEVVSAQTMANAQTVFGFKT